MRERMRDLGSHNFGFNDSPRGWFPSLGGYETGKSEELDIVVARRITGAIGTIVVTFRASV